MNGFIFWMLLAVGAQVGQMGPGNMGMPTLSSGSASGPPSIPKLSLASAPLDQPPNVAVQINPDDQKLEYIVQITPELKAAMEGTGKEFESTIDPEVAARISRIVVTLGKDPIVSTPMEDILRMPPVTRAVMANNVQNEVGRGKYADLETARSGEVRNVGGGTASLGLPGSAATGSASSMQGDMSDAATLAERLSGALRDADSMLAQNAASNFANDARGLAGAPSSKFSSTATPPLTNMQGTSIPNNGIGVSPAPLPGSNPAAAAPYPGLPTSTAPGTLQSTTAVPPSGFPTSTAPGYNGSSGLGYNPSAAGTGATGYPIQGGTASPTTTGNFGAVPRGTSMQPIAPYNTANPTSGPPTYGSGAYGNANTYGQTTSPYLTTNDPPSYSPIRTADSRNSNLPTTSSNVPSGVGLATSSYGNSAQGRQTSGAGADYYQTNNGTNGYTNAGTNTGYASGQGYQSRSGVENILPVMFVLSLVVNFYLGMLIRKLLGRYRNLLASVRSQAI